MPTKKSQIAVGHNPAGLTLAQVGRGWRLLSVEEVEARAGKPLPMTDDISLWQEGDEAWDAGWAGNSKCCTYATRKPTGYFLPASAKPKPAPAAKGGRGKKANRRLTNPIA
jgi:hypothetical protein